MIKHSFSGEPEAPGLFAGVKRFSQFKRNLVQLSKSLPKKNPIRWGRVLDISITNIIIGYLY